MLINLAFADTYTGVAQPLEAPIGECGIPAPDIREGTQSAQILAQFKYWACIEYRAGKSKQVSYLIEAQTDGQYLQLIPVPMKSAIDPMDPRLAVARVYQNCFRIRQLVYSQAIPLLSSKCSSQ